jgi:hypothetical protein
VRYGWIEIAITRGRGLAVDVEPVELVATALEDLVGTLLLYGADDDVVDLDRVGHGDDLAVRGPERQRLLVHHPVGDVFDAGFGQQVERLVGFGETGTFPAARRLSGQRLDGADRVGDGAHLVLDLVHRLLHPAMAHEIPAGRVRRLAGLAVEFAGRAVHREARLELARAQRLEEPPEADPHPVLVPCPVRYVGQQRLAHRRRQDGARHRPGRRPVLDVHDRPDGHARIAGQDELRPLVDRQIGRAPADAVSGLLRHRATLMPCSD